jgi:hypothetical protein
MLKALERSSRKTAGGVVAMVGAAVTAAGVLALLGSSGRLVIVLLLAGAGLMVLGSLLVTVDHPAAQIACVLVWLLVLGGLEALVFPPARLVGTLALAVGIAAALFGVLYAVFVEAGRRITVPAVGALLVVAVSLPLFALGVVGRFMDHSGSYLRRHSTRTTVDISGKCTASLGIGGSGRAVCPQASWRVGDDFVRGALEAGVDEVLGSAPFTHVDSIPAYVRGDQAYSESVMDDMDNDSTLQPLGRLPAWTLLALPVGVLTGVAFLWLDARGRRGTALPSSR